MDSVGVASRFASRFYEWSMLEEAAMNVKAVTPILNVSNMSQSFDWFESLGWTKHWEWGEPVKFAAVASGECEIFLCLDAQGGRGRGTSSTTFGSSESESSDQGVWMSLWVDDVDEVYQRCLVQHVEVTWSPTDMPWNVREMHVRHPDGHVFRISMPIDNGNA